MTARCGLPRAAGMEREPQFLGFPKKWVLGVATEGNPPHPELPQSSPRARVSPCRPPRWNHPALPYLRHPGGCGNVEVCAFTLQGYAGIEDVMPQPGSGWALDRKEPTAGPLMGTRATAPCPSQQFPGHSSGKQHFGNQTYLKLPCQVLLVAFFHLLKFGFQSPHLVFHLLHVL